MSRKKDNWLDIATSIDCAKYIREAKKLLNMQKFILSCNSKSYVNLGVFIVKLELFRNNIKDLDNWRSMASQNKDDFIYEFIEQAPDLFRIILEDITYGEYTG